MIHIHYKGPEMPCLRIIEKCININTSWEEIIQKVKSLVTQQIVYKQDHHLDH